MTPIPDAALLFEARLRALCDEYARLLIERDELQRQNEALTRRLEIASDEIREYRHNFFGSLMRRSGGGNGRDD